MTQQRDSFTLGDTIVLPGETRNVRLSISESYVSTPVEIPATVINGIMEGPILLVTAASHGDECNGTAVVRELIYGVDHSNLTGILVCAPVLNLPGFLRNERDLPDGRDLNRNFPGKPDGNSAQRIAHTIFSRIIQKCDYGLDLHTAGHGRSNILQVRGDMENNEVRRIAKAFGSEIIIDELGMAGTLRRASTEVGVPTITVEIGESQRFEKPLVRQGLQGVMNVLYELGMVRQKPTQPLFQVIVKKTEWVRADRGGILEMKINPRYLVTEGEEICTITNPFGKEVGVVRAPFTGMVVGITNYPMVSPGSPICHLVKLDKTRATVEAALRREARGLDKGVTKDDRKDYEEKKEYPKDENKDLNFEARKDELPEKKNTGKDGKKEERKEEETDKRDDKDEKTDRKDNRKDEKKEDMNTGMKEDEKKDPKKDRKEDLKADRKEERPDDKPERKEKSVRDGKLDNFVETPLPGRTVQISTSSTAGRDGNVPGKISKDAPVKHSGKTTRKPTLKEASDDRENLNQSGYYEDSDEDAEPEEKE